MKKTMKIEGMMCGHCEAAVDKALNAIDGVDAKVSHRKGTAKLKLERDVPEAELRKAVEDAGYKVTGIE